MLTTRTKRINSIPRNEIKVRPRNPVRLVSWTHNQINIGGLVRLSEAFFVECVYGLRTPHKAPTVGTLKWQPYETGWDLDAIVEESKNAGYKIVSLELSDSSKKLPTDLPEKMCLLVGNEGSGVPKRHLENSDLIVEIPQYGVVGSLNVVTATSIALYEWARQHCVSVA